jgi:hypothetical protein
MTVSADHDPGHVGVIWAMDLDQPAPQVTPRLPVTFGRIDTESLPALANAMGTNRFPEIRARFESGRRCYAAWSGNQLAAYGWVSFEEEYIGELNLHLRLVPGEAYIWDCVTLPAPASRRWQILSLPGSLRCGRSGCRAGRVYRKACWSRPAAHS